MSALQQLLIRYGSFTACILLLPDVSGQQLPPETIGKIKSAVVYLEVRHRLPLEDKEYKTSGSGFFINENGYLLTNYHVIQDGITYYDLNYPTLIEKIKVFRNSGSPAYKVYDATVFSVDRENDLAILAINDTGMTPFISLDTLAVPAETDPVWIFGYPFGDVFSVIQRGPEITVVKGAVAALRHNDLDRLVTIQIEGEVNPGNSGGPVINEKGNAVGVINIAMRSINMNFAVPAWYYYRLSKGLALDKGSKSNPVTLSLTSTPPSAHLYIDHQFNGITPVTGITLLPGNHVIGLMKDGYCFRYLERNFSHGDNVNVDMKPVRNIPVLTGNNPESELFSGKPVVNHQAAKILMEENFNDPESIKKWEQSTGGTGVRTWYIENNALHQHESNGTLHALYLGERSWENYTVMTSVKINNEEGDSRAGLIFRETDEGFYLFRIHRNTDKAQLAYHCKEPFGWFILDEKKLQEEVSDQWYNLTVQSDGNNISCLLNEEVVFSEPSTLSMQGRVGFYSVESYASFDSLLVFAGQSRSTEISESLDKMKSFWFSDYFTTKSGWWYTCNDAWEPDYWIFTPGGLLQNQNDHLKRYCEFMKYSLEDFIVNAVISLGQAGDSSEFEFFFRKNGNHMSSLVYSASRNELSLYSVSGRNRKLLKMSKPDFFIADKTILLTVKAEGTRIQCSVSNHEIINARTGTVPEDEGTFGFGCRNLKLVLHQMNVSSVNSENR